MQTRSRSRSAGASTVDVAVSRMYSTKPAAFEGLRLMEWRRTTQCMEHPPETCWHHKQLNCKNHSKTTHFTHPLRFPRILGRGLQVGQCKDCVKKGLQCTASGRYDRFYGAFDSDSDEVIVHRIKYKAGIRSIKEGTIDWNGLRDDSDAEVEIFDEVDKIDDDDDEGDGVKISNIELDKIDSLRPPLRSSRKRRRFLDPDSDHESSDSNTLDGCSRSTRSARLRVIISPDITIKTKTLDHPAQEALSIRTREIDTEEEKPNLKVSLRSKNSTWDPALEIKKLQNLVREKDHIISSTNDIVTRLKEEKKAYTAKIGQL
ncbi:uncharacterized protein L201_003920 [Kwoniella dendrophila CBS 6074]|uniref:Uncharacterized protein n=1 Tax=Kwoniella dendrophila CBS 6074 TaxID=1295534 RepID=A0AAX4JVY0_9TREE